MCFINYFWKKKRSDIKISLNLGSRELENIQSKMEGKKQEFSKIF